MAEAKGARRAAERAALEMLRGGGMVTAAGELAAADAARTAATNALADARARGEQQVAEAQARAAALAAEARAAADAAQATYTQAWRDACAAGWAPAKLRTMGYQQPAPPRRRTQTRPAANTQTAGTPTAGTPTVDVRVDDAPAQVPTQPAAEGSPAAQLSSR